MKVKSYGLTIQMKRLCQNFHNVLSSFQKFTAWSLECFPQILTFTNSASGLVYTEIVQFRVHYPRAKTYADFVIVNLYFSLEAKTELCTKIFILILSML